MAMGQEQNYERTETMLRECKACGGDGFRRVCCGCRGAIHDPLLGNPEEEHVGIYHKFWVRRTDGSSRPGGKHADCEYFVLDWNHDPFAIPAMRAYAEACQAEYPELAQDILDRAKTFAERAKRRALTRATAQRQGAK